MTTENAGAQNIAVVERALAALARGDAEAVIAATHPDLRFQLPYERGAPVLDRAAFTELVHGLVRNFQRFTLTPVEFIEALDPNQLVARYEGDCLSADGSVEYRNSYVALFEFTDGLISRWREYANPVLTRKMNEQLGAVSM